VRMRECAQTTQQHTGPTRRKKQRTNSLSLSRLQAVCVHRIDTAQERAFLRKRRGSPTLHLHPHCVCVHTHTLCVAERCTAPVLYRSHSSQFGCAGGRIIFLLHCECTYPVHRLLLSFSTHFSSKPLATTTTTIHTLGEANAVRL